MCPVIGELFFLRIVNKFKAFFSPLLQMGYQWRT